MRNPSVAILSCLICTLATGLRAAQTPPAPPPAAQPQPPAPMSAVAVDLTLGGLTSVKVQDAPPDEAILAIVNNRAAKTNVRIDVRGTAKRRITLDLKDVTVATALVAVAKQGEVNVYWSGDKLILAPPGWLSPDDIRATPFTLLWSPALDEPIALRQADLVAAEARAAGFNRDPANVGSLLGYLTNGEYRLLRYYLPAQQSLISLGRLADPSSLDPLVRLWQKPKDLPRELVPYYRVAVARIRTESASPSTTPVDKLPARLKLFLRSLGLSPLAVEGAVQRHSAALASGKPAPIDAGVIAMRQMADMIATVRKTGADTSAAEKVVRFGLDPPSRLRIELAALAPHERVRTLIARLSALKALDENAYRMIQALGDEGPLAVEKIGAALRAAAGERGENPQAGIGIQALLSALLYTGGPERAHYAEAFMRDQDAQLARAARSAAWGLRSGSRRVYAPEY